MDIPINNDIPAKLLDLFNIGKYKMQHGVLTNQDNFLCVKTELGTDLFYFKFVENSEKYQMVYTDTLDYYIDKYYNKIDCVDNAKKKCAELGLDELWESNFYVLCRSNYWDKTNACVVKGMNNILELIKQQHEIIVGSFDTFVQTTYNKDELFSKI
jgi:hypothetical protein